MKKMQIQCVLRRHGYKKVMRYGQMLIYRKSQMSAEAFIIVKKQKVVSAKVKKADGWQDSILEGVNLQFLEKEAMQLKAGIICS